VTSRQAIMSQATRNAGPPSQLPLIGPEAKHQLYDGLLLHDPTREGLLTVWK
jgi:hypothetical protein